jgi:hypothetical protein
MEKYAVRTGKTEFERLSKLPKTREARWSAFCALLERSGAIADTGPFLEALRLDRKTVCACRAGAGLARASLPKDRASWKRLVKDCGADCAVCAAAAAYVLSPSGFMETLNGILDSGEAVSLKDLKINGKDLKKIGFDVTPIGTKFPVTFDFTHAPAWLVPVYRSLDYLNSVWSTTLLGFFIAGAFVTFLSGFARTALRSDGFKGQLWGTALGIPNMFCTCCAVSTVTGLRKAGAGLGPSLSFFVTAPTLNLVVILLAFTLLPLKYAMARLLLGLVTALFITWFVARMFPEKQATQPKPVFEEEDLSVPALLRLWLKNSWQIAVSARDPGRESLVSNSLTLVRSGGLTLHDLVAALRAWGEVRAPLPEPAGQGPQESRAG